MALESAVRAWLARLDEDEAARRRWATLAWVLSWLFTIFGFVVVAILLRRQGAV